MAKVFQTTLILSVVAVALCYATPAKLDKIRTTRNRFLARQEIASSVIDEDVSSQTPYPPAGIRPEVSFDLPTEQKLVAPANHYLPPLVDAAMFYSAPAEVYGPPAETYGPPEVSDEDANGKSIPDVPEDNLDEDTHTEENQTEEAQTEETSTEEPDSVQQNDKEQQATNSEDKADVDASKVEEQVDNFIPERLVLAKSTSTIKAAKLKQFAPLKQNINKTQQFYLINGSLYTIA